MNFRALAFIVLFGVGCVASTPVTGKGPELGELSDGKLDSFYAPTELGELAFDELATTRLSEAQRFVAWTFSLSDTARIDLRTQRATPRGADVDTVLYLYRRQANGSWGRAIFKNDDVDDSGWAATDADYPLAAGAYRVIVKGYDADDVGRIGVMLRCDGAGCATAACSFGERYSELRRSNEWAVEGESVDSPTDLLPLDRARILVVAQLADASFTDVDTVFDTVDAVEVMVLRHFETDEELVGYSVKLDGTLYAAIFPAESAEPIAKVDDDQFYDCER